MALDGDDNAVGNKTPDPMAAPADDEPLLATASRRLREPAHRRWLGCTFGVILILAGTLHAGKPSDVHRVRPSHHINLSLACMARAARVTGDRQCQMSPQASRSSLSPWFGRATSLG